MARKRDKSRHRNNKLNSSHESRLLKNSLPEIKKDNEQMEQVEQIENNEQLLETMNEDVIEPDRIITFDPNSDDIIEFEKQIHYERRDDIDYSNTKVVGDANNPNDILKQWLQMQQMAGMFYTGFIHACMDPHDEGALYFGCYLGTDGEIHQDQFVQSNENLDTFQMPPIEQLLQHMEKQEELEKFDSSDLTDPDYIEKLQQSTGLLDHSDDIDIFKGSGIPVEFDNEEDRADIEKIREALGEEDFEKFMDRIVNEPFEDDPIKAAKKRKKKEKNRKLMDLFETGYDPNYIRKGYNSKVLYEKCKAFGLELDEIDLRMFDDYDYIPPDVSLSDEEEIVKQFREDIDPGFAKNNLIKSSEYRIKRLKNNTNEKIDKIYDLKELLFKNKIVDYEDWMPSSYSDWLFSRKMKFKESDILYKDPDPEAMIDQLDLDIEKIKENCGKEITSIKSKLKSEIKKIDKGERIVSNYDNNESVFSGDYAWKKKIDYGIDLSMWTMEECEKYGSLMPKPDLERQAKKEKKLLRKKYGYIEGEEESKNNIVYFYADRLRDLPAMQQYLCKNFPEKYNYGYPPKKKKKKKKKLTAAENYWLSLETPEEREFFDQQEEAFAAFDKKKKKKESKASRLFKKYFTELDKEGRKLDKNGNITEEAYKEWFFDHLPKGKVGKKVLKIIRKEKKIVEENPWMQFEMEEFHNSYLNAIMKNKSKKEKKAKRMITSDNANRIFNNFLSETSTDYYSLTKKGRIAIDTLEDELINTTLNDPLMMSNDNIAVRLREKAEKSRKKAEKEIKKKMKKKKKKYINYSEDDWDIDKDAKKRLNKKLTKKEQNQIEARKILELAARQDRGENIYESEDYKNLDCIIRHEAMDKHFKRMKKEKKKIMKNNEKNRRSIEDILVKN